MNTAQDVVDHLLSCIGGGAQDGEHRAVRQAVIHGVREVLQCRDWLWHTRTGSFLSYNVVVPVSANGITIGQKSVTVSAADGEKMVVGRIIQVENYFDSPCRIMSVTTSGADTVIAVDQTAKATKQSNQTVNLVMQTFYDLPAELRDIDTLVTHTVGTLHCYVSPQEWHQLEINTRGTGEPYYYTVMRSDVNQDCWQIRFVGIPTDGTMIHYTYRYLPKSIKWMGYEALCRQGTVSTSGVTVTGTDTEFPPDIAGSVIRFGTATSEADPLGSLQPFIRERYILARGSETSLTVTEDLAPRTGVKYAISDPIDASPTMYTAVLSACEMWYARIAGKPADAAMQIFNRDLRLAMENDQVAPFSGRPSNGHYPTPRTMGWHSTIMGDVE